MSEEGWTVNDTWPPLEGTALDKGEPVDLTTAVSLTAHILRPAASNLTKTAVPGDQVAAKGSWSVAWAAGDLCVPYAYSVDIEVEWPGSHRQTFGPAKFPVASAIG
jgi:hypothetical protein